MRANVFHLTDPPKPVEKPDAVLLTLPKVNITGFTRRSDEPIHALFATVPKDPKEPAKYFRLTEGEKEDILQVIRIHPEQDAVDVIIAGTPVTLTTKSNSFIQPLPAPPKGGVPVAPVVAPVAYNGSPQPVRSADANSGGVIVAGGGMTSAPGGGSVTTIGSNSGSAGFSSGGNGIGSNQGFGGPSYGAAGSSGTPFQPVPTRSQLTPAYPPEYHPQTPAESAAMLAIGHQLTPPESQGGPPLPPILSDK